MKILWVFVILYIIDYIATSASSYFMEWSHLDKSLGMQALLGAVNKLHITVLDVPQCYLGRVLPPNAKTYIKTQSLVLCCYVVGQLASY